MVTIPLVKGVWTKVSEVSTTIQLKSASPNPAFLCESLTAPTFTPELDSDVILIPPVDLFDFTFTDKYLWIYTPYVNTSIAKDI